MKTNQFRFASPLSVAGWRLGGFLRPPFAFLWQSSLLVLLLLVLLALPVTAQPQFTNATNNASLYCSNNVFVSAGVAQGDTLTNVNSAFVDAISNSPAQLRPPFTNGSSSHRLRAQSNEWAATQFQGEAENEIGYLLAPQLRTEAGNKPTVNYGPRLEPQTPKPINVIQSQKYPGMEYSGILVQAAKSNPFQLINPFAPAIYGDGEDNVVRNLFTSEIEGLKIWQISF